MSNAELIAEARSFKLLFAEAKETDLIVRLADALERADANNPEAIAPRNNPSDRDGEAGPVAWRCFHCDDTFTDFECAKQHFGEYQDCTPICKVGAERYRDLENQLEVWRSESDEASKTFYRLGADHTQALRRVEQEGYDKGLRDGRADALAHPPSPPAPSWERAVSRPYDINYEGAMADLHEAVSVLIRRINGEANLASAAEWVRLNYPKRAQEIRDQAQGSRATSAFEQPPGAQAGPARSAPTPRNNPSDREGPVAWAYVNTDGECEQIEWGEPFDDPSVTKLYLHPPRPPALPEGWPSDEQIERAARAICDEEWNGSQPPFDRKPPSFGLRYRQMARVALLAASPPIPKKEG